MVGRRHLRLVAYGDDVDPPPPEPRRRRRDAALFARLLAEYEARGWHPAVAAVEAGQEVDRRHAEQERKRRR